jgi:hypothetical protein
MSLKTTQEDGWRLVRFLLESEPQPYTMADALRNDPAFWRGVVAELLQQLDAQREATAEATLRIAA